MSKKEFHIDWLNHGLEFLVVIIGILIAFQLNKYSTNKQEQKIIKTHLEQLQQETEFNKNSFESAIKYTQANLSKLDTIFNLLFQSQDYHKVNQLSLELLNLGGVYIRKNAYQHLIETGDIRLMNDFEKKQQIIDLYEYYKWVEAFDEISRSLYINDFYPYLKNNFDLVGRTIQSEDIYQAKVFKNNLGAYKRTSFNKLKKYKDCLIEIENYLNLKNKE